MATVNITVENFAETIRQGGIVLLDWWAPWCGPCRAFGPIFDRVAAANPDVVFGKINTEQEQELAGQFEIRSIPTLMVIRDGVLLFAQAGMLPEKALTELLTKVRQLDMEQVKRQAKPDRSSAAPAASV